ncbi:MULTISPECIES: transglutaminase domain-containing protein [unclassified Paenibacillus]|uniref:transglutaminase TgpA family protein n=1 Tax=unclassified Paenibacillus TaxID=185978 RepID=UPI001C11E3B9|nr:MULTISPECIES: transglutaminase domain-containing protein [unclassified Paenibacillus]MBU5444286.1 DUF3488 and transglutaminase-like domain-containing protein [Paenibacillus sp. MSJ-34]CAH0121015.1 hypothetical protein PAE9249_03540 [Paenibacillus sp. CECT 9249]
MKLANSRFVRLLALEWQSKLSQLFIVIILWQWQAMVEPVWYNETLDICRLSLIAVFAVHALMPIHIAARRTIIAVLVVAIHGFVLNRYGLLHSIDGKFHERLVQFGLDILPYLWFALLIWFLYEFINHIVVGKGRIIAFLVVDIVCLGILDSFTMAMLWEEVALTVIAGLGWLAAEHFNRFKAKYPEGWNYVASYPLRLIMTVILIFTAVILSGIFMPEARPLLMDPYTAWKTMKGEEVPVFINGKGEAVSISRNASSGYSREDSELGGGFEYSFDPIMKVQTTGSSYWRGETKSLYTGKGWENAEEGRSSVPVISNMELPLTGNNSLVKTRELTQTVTMIADQQFPVLFGAFPIAKVMEIDGEAEMRRVRWQPKDMELRWARQGSGPAYPRTYTIVSQVPIMNENDLRQVTFQQIRSEQYELSDYLQLPDNFPERVKELAVSVTEEAAGPYDKVKALEQYLRMSFIYSNSPDTSLKVSDDFVESFLFEIKQGYCDYYSTAMVMMARSLGIPARWVKGYAPGVREGYRPEMSMPQMMDETIDDSGTYTVTNADAHSWAEVYFPSYGWIPVEATPGFVLPAYYDLEQPDVETSIPLVPETAETETATNAPVSSGLKGVIWIIALSAVLAIGAGLLLWRYRSGLRSFMLRIAYGKKLTRDQMLIVETERWLRYCRRKGLQRADHETVREAVGRWSKERSSLAKTWSVLLQLFEKAKYSPESITEQELALAQSEIKHLKQRL